MRTSNLFSIAFTPIFIPVVVAAIFGLPGCSSSGTAPVDREEGMDQGTSGATVPISLSERRFVMLTVETGGQSSQFFLYPSLAKTVIFEGKESGFSTDQSFVQQRSGSEREVQLDPVRIGSMSVGPVPARLTKRKRVRALSTVLAKENLDQVEGVLGYDFLRDKKLTIDYRERKLRLERTFPSSVSAVAETLQPGKSDFDLVDTAKSKRVISFRAGVNGEYETDVAIDFGIPVNLIHGAARERWNLKTLTSQKLKQRFGAASSEFDFISLASLWIGGRVFRDVLVRLREQMKSQLGVDADIILGNYFFSDKVVQINFPQRWIGVQSANEKSEE